MSMHSPTLTKTFRANVDIGPRRLVFLSADGEVGLAAAGASLVMGVSDVVGAAAGGSIDVHLGGTCEVLYGGNIARGGDLTATADGKAVATTTAGNRVVGTALVSGVDGDIGVVLLGPRQRV